jgi:outer membrane immunogenic protein
MRIGFAALLIAAASIGTAHSAMAADMPAKAPVYKAPAEVVAYRWSGFYVGANVGAATQRNCWTFTNPPPVTPEGCHGNIALVAGGQIGANWQTGNIVLGLEASGNWANLKDSNDSIGFAGFTNQTRTDAIGLFTGRVGVAWNNVLAYVKGGAAVTHNEYNSFFTLLPTTFQAETDTRWGWTVGAGFEYGFAPNWSAGVEYDYIQTGSQDVVFPPGAIFGLVPGTEQISQRIHMATLRVNYRFAPLAWR